jgi:hypothetical protein
MIVVEVKPLAASSTKKAVRLSDGTGWQRGTDFDLTIPAQVTSRVQMLVNLAAAHDPTVDPTALTAQINAALAA